MDVVTDETQCDASASPFDDEVDAIDIEPIPFEGSGPD